jgi:excisionase family DNA binding protein
MINSTESTTTQPVWLRLPEAVRLTGLSRSKVYELLAAGRIRSASLRDPGQRHATRLIDRADLLAFIERHASGGSGQIEAAVR